MMFDRIRQLCATSAEFVSAEAALAQKKLIRLGVFVACTLVALLIAAACIIGLLVGAMMQLAPALGAGAAVLTVSSATLLVLAIAAILVRGRIMADDSGTSSQPLEASPEHRVRRSKAEIRQLLGLSPDEHAESHRRQQFRHSPEFDDAVHQRVEQLISRPAVLISAAFAVVSILGISRTIRLARSAAGLAATGVLAYRAASSMKDHLTQNDDDRHRHNGSTHRGTPRSTSTSHRGHANDR